MQLRSSFAVILCIASINLYVYCSPKRDDRWWNDIKSRLETRQRSHWTTIDNKSVPEPVAQTTNRSVKRSTVLFDPDNPFQSRSKNWEKSYSRRRDFDSTWRDNQPLRERFVETEWDDDVPVRHVFRDSSSAADEGVNRNRMGDEFIRDKSRQWARDDYNDKGFNRGSMRDVFSSARNINNNKRITNYSNNANTSAKPKVVTNSMDTRNPQQASKADRTDRVVSLNFMDSDSKKKDRERLNQLAKQIFNLDEDEKESPRSTTSGNGYQKNAVNSFSRNTGNTFETTSSGNEFNRNNEKKQNKVSAELVKPLKPKFNVIFETTPKPVQTSNTAKLIQSNVQNVAEKPKSSTTPSSQTRFGWRSSVNHSNNPKNQKLQTNEESVEDDDSFEDDLDDDITTTKAPSPPPRFTTKAVTKATVKPTTRPEYTTYRLPDTTRPQTTTSFTNKPNNRETTYLTTTRPKIVEKTSNVVKNDLEDTLAPNKKQHRMGSWVDSDSLDYMEGETETDDFSNERSPGLNQRSQPIVVGQGEEEEFEEEQLPERVAEEPIAPIETPKFARQQASGGEGSDDDKPGWRLEDALPGVPGTDYPTFATIPKTTFDCKGHEWPGYYADVDTQCQVFHICQAGGRKNSFLCPNGTMFNQLVFVCDWWHNVQCGDSPTHYGLNQNIYDHNWESKRVTNTEKEGSVRRSGTLIEAAEPLTTNPATTTEPTEPIEAEPELSEVNDPTEKTANADNTDDSSVDFVDEDNEETGSSTRIRSPIRIYRTSRIITGQDRQKRRRRKRGYLRV